MRRTPLSTAASSDTSRPRRTARAMPLPNQPTPQVLHPLLATKLASRDSSHPSPFDTCRCTAASVPTARCAKGKGRPNQRAWVRAARPP